MMPPKDAILQTADADYFYFKADILAGLVTYSTDKRVAANLETITAERAKEIIEMNKQGEKPESLLEEGQGGIDDRPKDLLEDDISRFDKAKKKKKKRKQKVDVADTKKQEKAVAKDNEPAAQEAGTAENLPKQGKPQQPKGDKPQQPKGDKPQNNRRNQRKPRPGKPQEGAQQPPKDANDNKPKQND